MLTDNRTQIETLHNHKHNSIQAEDFDVVMDKIIQDNTIKKTICSMYVNMKQQPYIRRIIVIYKCLHQRHTMKKLLVPISTSHPQSRNNHKYNLFMCL